MAKEETHRHPLILPAELHKRLKALADRDRRPLNTYLVIELEKLADAGEKANG